MASLPPLLKSATLEYVLHLRLNCFKECHPEIKLNINFFQNTYEVGIFTISDKIHLRLVYFIGKSSCYNSQVNKLFKETTTPD